MEAKHTPEPWYPEWDDSEPGEVRAVWSEATTPHKMVCSFVSEPDASRIVACVNGCAGIADPSAVGDMLDALRDAVAFMESARHHFPKSIRNADTFKLNTTIAQAGTAIARAEGRR